MSSELNSETARIRAAMRTMRYRSAATEPPCVSMRTGAKERHTAKANPPTYNPFSPNPPNPFPPRIPKKTKPSPDPHDGVSLNVF
jgi:hypothetical protein